jgi:hypothetical protein
MVKQMGWQMAKRKVIRWQTEKRTGLRSAMLMGFLKGWHLET